MIARYTFDGFLRRHGQLLARFRLVEHDGWIDTRWIPLDVRGANWLSTWSEEELSAEPEVGAALVAAARECLALARMAHIVREHDRANRTPTPLGGRSP